MLPILCPRCKIRVLPSPEGICPGCRKVIIVPVQRVQVAVPVSAKECPECQAPLAENAVLCVACGFHLERGGFLGTAVERDPFSEVISPEPLPTDLQPPDLNPYAPPAILHEAPAPVEIRTEVFVADLTPFAAMRASGIVADATGVYLNMILCYFTCIGAFFIGPWYGYRLYSWYELNRDYCELRNPTPRLSDHYGLAQDFQAAKSRIWAGFIVGAIALTMVLGAMLIACLSRPANVR